MGGKNYRNNKLQREQLRKEQAKKDLQEAKQRKRGEPVLERGKPQLNERKKILIVCEGENTEPSYFEHFRRMLRNANIRLEIVPSSNRMALRGTDPKTIVAKAKKLQSLEKTQPFDEIWCVFDHDPDPANPNKSNNFNNCIKQATSLKFRVAYPNQAFEYWIILHFENHSGNPLHRDLYYDKINRHLQEYKLAYDKDRKIISPEIFALLQAIDPKESKTRQQLAIERAKKIMAKWEAEDPSRSNPAKEESSTTVFELVEALITK